MTADSHRAETLDGLLAERLLHEHGLIPRDHRTEIEPADGGISARTYLVRDLDDPALDHVVKQPRPRFQSREPWEAPQRRSATEHHATHWFREVLGPSRVPAPIHHDRTRHILILRAAPRSFTPWKGRLLSGELDLGLAVDVARTLARIHNAGREPNHDAFRTAPPPHDLELLDTQRTEPYLHAAANRLPAWAPFLAMLARDLHHPETIIHGDYSPKNILTDGRRLMLIDHEVTNRGPAAFDLAFLITHLSLKAIHVPADAGMYAHAVRAVHDAYQRDAQINPPWPQIASWIAGLTLARVLGKSPVEYLNPPQRQLALRYAAWTKDAAQQGTLEDLVSIISEIPEGSLRNTGRVAVVV